MPEHYHKPPILERIPGNRHAVIEASAGTGKTFTIAHLVVDLLVRGGVPLEKILILTFTERAATELRQRIRSKIEEILFNPCRETTCHHEKPGAVWWINEETRGRLSRALFSFDAASIGTIHGFFNRVLTEHAFDNGRLFEGTLVDGRTLFGRAFKQALRRSLAQRPGDPAELLALWLDLSGKDVRWLEDRLYACHASRRIILPDFSIDFLKREIETNPLFEVDLQEKAERFQQSLKAAKVHGNTIKAIATRLAKLSDLIRGPNRGWQIALDESFQATIRYISESIHGRTLEDKGAARLADAITGWEDNIVSIQAALVQTCLPMVCQVLEQQKTATGDFDYDDLISGVAMALNRPGGAELLRAMRARYHVALVDEFQDTDSDQWAFFRRVFIESEEGNLVYLIGDPKQAIYGFRGADVATYQAACRLIVNSQSPAVPLLENFRSTAELIDAYNHIFNRSADEPYFTGDIRYGVPVKPGKEWVLEHANGSRAVPVELLKIEPTEGRLGIAELRRGLAGRIAREVRRLLSSPDDTLRIGLKGGELQSIGPGDVFILTAKNTEALEVAQALREEGVRFAFYKQDGLFQTDEARDVRDLLAAIDDPTDRAQRGRALLTPFFAVPLAALPELSDLSDLHPIVERFSIWNELADARRFEMLFMRILDDSGIVRRELFCRDDERALTNYLHLFEVLLENARTTGCELGDLITMITAYIQGTRKPPGEDGNVQRLETDRAAVQIMTIHKSKGLEAAVVFLFGGFTAFPSDGMWRYHDDSDNERRFLYIGDLEAAKATAAKEQNEELERLYYVALTRAKARLYLPYVAPEHWDQRSWRGGYRHVNERLTKVVSELVGSGKEHLFQLVPSHDQPHHAGPREPARPTSPLASWQPDASLLKERFHSWEFSNDRKRHSGYEVTSYSRMKSTVSGDVGLVPLGRVELDREAPQVSVAASPAEEELPGGVATGLMLHEILELVPFDSLCEGTPVGAWGVLKEVADVVESAMTHHAIDPSHRAAATEMVYQALTVEISTKDGRSIPGLYRCANYLREMEFLFPYPEHGHPALSAVEPGAIVIERGFIKGYMDLVVEHDGLVYFADWKSDVLSSYGADTIREHVALHYELQIRLYAVALVKALGIRSESQYEVRFGGLVYIFLRGLRHSGDQSSGVYFQRPGWHELLQFEKALREFPDLARGGHL